MRVYLDTSSLQRPLDSKEQIRNAIEAEAILAVLALGELGMFELVSSEALLFETQRNPNPARREFALEILAKATHLQIADEQVVQRTKEIIQKGVMPLDALHVASAERAQVDFFCTCDDKLLKRQRSSVNQG